MAQDKNNENTSDAQVETERGEISGDADGNAQAQTAGIVVSQAKQKKPPRKPLIRSIRSWTMLNYTLFTAAIFAVLWIVFFVGLFWFYGSMLRGDISDVGREAMLAFPKTYDDTSMSVMYRLRLNEIAHNHDMAAIVFSQTDGGYEIHVSVDNMGDGAADASEVFVEIMERVDLNGFFGRGEGNVDTVSTSEGKFLCYANMRVLESDAGTQQPCFLLLFKQYAVFNSQTIKIVYTLVLCTVIVLAIACMFAYLASGFQTKRLTDFSQKAKQLAAGDRNVQFSGGGYDEYDNLAAALNAATRKMEQSEQLQRDFIANVSHDIRTPITMIRAYAEMLRDMPLDEKKRARTAGVIISEADRLTKLTNDVMDYSKLQSGTAEFKIEQCDLSSLGSATLEHFGIYRERDGVKFVVNIEKKLVVDCDPHRIEQVLYNLISNAINYCGDDKTVLLHIFKKDGNARVEVGDHGKGIKPDELASVWDRYYRTAHAKRTTVGSGLGLSICKNILDSHGAKYGANSVVGEGSTFWFELPLSAKPPSK